MDAPADLRVISVDELRRQLASGTPPLVIDVRRKVRYLEAPDRIAGARRRDPDRVESWKAALPAPVDVVVYCVYGHEVSQGVARALGARYLEGGIEAWRAAGGALEPRPGQADE